MTPEQFIFWLQGYLASGTAPDHGKLVEALARVGTKTPAISAPAPLPSTLLSDWEEIAKREKSRPYQSPPQPWREKPTTGTPRPAYPYDIICGTALSEVRNAS